MVKTLPPVIPFDFLDPKEVEEAWRRFASVDWQATRETPPDLQQIWPILLDGLPLIAEEDRVRDEHSRPLALERLVSEILERKPDEANAWTFERGGKVCRVLPEMARRLLALGYTHTEGSAEEDPLLNPRLAKINPLCQDEALTTARALAAIELANASILSSVISRRLRIIKEQAKALFWLTPFLKEEMAQCLLINTLVVWRTEAEREDADRLLLALLPLYEQQEKDWPQGPLTTACALGLLLRHRKEDQLEKLGVQVNQWNGWNHEDCWPTRHPGTSIADLKFLLTDRIAAILGVADRKLSRKEALKNQIERWPPLGSFCLPSAAK